MINLLSTIIAVLSIVFVTIFFYNISIFSKTISNSRSIF